uniref:Methyl-accepting chemotaxis protein n=1 Tax=Panagrellus redivivus TaxID=6233 RepID=A0A7E4W4J6_PANRE
MILEPQHSATWGLLKEVRDNNFYATYLDGHPKKCPRQVIDGRWKITIVDMTDCPVIVDGAKLVKENADKPKNTNVSMKWVIAICVGVVLLLLVIVIAGIYFYMRFK